ncbi:MAG TPA: hypothetical protein VGB13_04550 [Candidatus Krumholzibacteria bacterium]
MIVDLCQPLNPGERRTVRIVMSTAEAARPEGELAALGYSPESPASDLFLALGRALNRDEARTEP